MNKREFVMAVTAKLKEVDARKPIKASKHKFYIRDSENNEAEFEVKQQDKNLLYNSDDVAKIVDGCIAVIQDVIKAGDEVTIHGIGKLGITRRAATRVIEPNTGTWCDVPAMYVPKFTAGNLLKIAARLHEDDEA